MSIQCPNKSSQAWQDLSKKYGEFNAMTLYTLNNEEIPTINEAAELFSKLTPNKKRIRYALVDEEGNIVAYVSDPNNWKEKNKYSVYTLKEVDYEERVFLLRKLYLRIYLICLKMIQLQQKL